MADIIDLWQNPAFNATLLARFGRLTTAHIRENRLYFDLEADPHCPDDWLARLQVDVSDLPNRYLATAALEGWVTDPDVPGLSLLRTAPLDLDIRYEGECSDRVVVTLMIGDRLRRLYRPSRTRQTAL